MVFGAMDRRTVLALPGITAASSLVGDKDRVEPGRGISTERALFAGDHGVVGNGIADDTQAVQAFLNTCAEQRRTAYFGSLVCRITGPLVTNVAVVFDQSSYGSRGDAGFFATFAPTDRARRAYVALTIWGQISDMCVTIYGGGDMNVAAGAKTVQNDAREVIHGFEFGDARPGSSKPFLASWVRSIRAYNLAGRGVRLHVCYDCTFEVISVEKCGTQADWGFSTGDRQFNPDDFMQEVKIGRLQVEQCFGKALHIGGYSLSCQIDKVHSERFIPAEEGGVGWHIGGNITVSAIRLQSYGTGVAEILGANSVITGLRPEGVSVRVGAVIGHRLRLIEPTGSIGPIKGQIGDVVLDGGQFDLRGLTGGSWIVNDAVVGSFGVGDMVGQRGDAIKASRCRIGALKREGEGTSAVFTNCRIAGTQLLHSTLLIDSEFDAGGKQLELSYALLSLSNSRLKGGIRADMGGLILKNGSVVEGGYESVFAHRALVDLNSDIRGTVRNFRPPDGSEYIGAISQGTICRNLDAKTVGVVAWVYKAGSWKPAYRIADSRS